VRKKNTNVVERKQQLAIASEQNNLCMNSNLFFVMYVSKRPAAPVVLHWIENAKQREEKEYSTW
jgi:hypothetical protein